MAQSRVERMPKHVSESSVGLHSLFQRLKIGIVPERRAMQTSFGGIRRSRFLSEKTLEGGQGFGAHMMFDAFGVCPRDR
jgi:hypothetical protein